MNGSRQASPCWSVNLYEVVIVAQDLAFNKPEIVPATIVVVKVHAHAVALGIYLSPPNIGCPLRSIAYSWHDLQCSAANGTGARADHPSDTSLPDANDLQMTQDSKARKQTGRPDTTECHCFVLCKDWNKRR